MTRPIIRGTLTTAGGDILSITLRGTVAGLQGLTGVEDQAIAHIELLDVIPNGEYTLEYFYLKPFHGSVRVVNGSLEVL